MEFHLPCHPQRRCKEHAFRTRKGSYRSAAEHDCRPGRFLRQVDFRIVQRPLDSARAYAGWLALSELRACIRRQQKNRLAPELQTRIGLWAQASLLMCGWLGTQFAHLSRTRASKLASSRPPTVSREIHRGRHISAHPNLRSSKTGERSVSRFPG